MKIKSIISEYRNDFNAVMECEHCGHQSTLTTGHHDNYYHTSVIPAMTCKACGKNRSGEAGADETANDLGNRRDAGPIGGASVLTDELEGKGRSDAG